MSLYDVRFDGGEVIWPHRRLRVEDAELGDVLVHAEELLTASRDGHESVEVVALPPDAEALRWFPLPGEEARATR
jgi:hypothetical protein